MSEFVTIQNYTRNGNMGISHRAFEQIAQIVTNKIQGVTVKENDDRLLFSLHNPIKCEIVNNVVTIKIEVKVARSLNAGEISAQIQEEVALALASMTEVVSLKTVVKIVGFEE